MTQRPPIGRVALLLGLLIALTIIGSSGVAVALPQLGEELGIDLSGRAWILATFSLAFSIATAIFGRLADLAGLRLPLRIGVALFAAGSLVAASASSFPVLIAGRILQGVGAGAVPVLGVGVVAALYEGEERTRALGSLTSIVALVSGAGPLIGGAIAAAIGWRGVLALPVLALVLAEPVARLAPGGRGQGEQGLDLHGAFLTGTVVIGLVLALQAPATGAGLPVLAGAVAAGLAAAALLGRHIRRRPEGFIPLALVRDRRYVLTVAAGPPLLAAYFILLLAIPQVLRDEHGWSPLHIGAALLPAAVAGALASRLTPRLTARWGRFGLIELLAAGSAVGLLVAAAGAPGPIPLVAGFALTSCGFAAGQVALLDELTASVDAAVRGVAVGVFQLAFFTGGAIGTAGTGGLAGILSLRGAVAALAVLPMLALLSALAADRTPAPVPTGPD